MEDSKEIVIDTNFFMIPFQFNVDIVTELKIVLSAYKLVTPQFVIDELVGLKHNNKGKIRKEASLALKIALDKDIEIIDDELLEGESVDDGLVRISKNKILATNDIRLKNKAKANNIKVAYLRQKRYIAVDGFI